MTYTDQNQRFQDTADRLRDESRLLPLPEEEQDEHYFRSVQTFLETADDQKALLDAAIWYWYDSSWPPDAISPEQKIEAILRKMRESRVQHRLANQAADSPPDSTTGQRSADSDVQTQTAHVRLPRHSQPQTSQTSPDTAPGCHQVSQPQILPQQSLKPTSRNNPIDEPELMSFVPDFPPPHPIGELFEHRPKRRYLFRSDDGREFIGVRIEMRKWVTSLECKIVRLEVLTLEGCQVEETSDQEQWIVHVGGGKVPVRKVGLVPLDDPRSTSATHY